MKRIAFFDFDGTLTRADTMLEIIRFHFGKKRFLWGLVLLSPWLIGLKIGWVTNQKAKEKMLTHFFRGMDERDFQKIARQFFEEKYHLLIRPEAVRKLNALRESGFEIVIVTASASAWVAPWAAKLEAKLIASELEVMDGRLTGKLVGDNCNFSEKVNRIKALYDVREYDEIYCFGDSKGDKEMLQLATHPFYRRFE